MHLSYHLAVFQLLYEFQRLQLGPQTGLGGQELNQRDALGVWETDAFELKAEEDSEILLVEVPMNF